MYIKARHMPDDWISPPGMEALNLDLAGSAYYYDPSKDPDSELSFPIFSHPFYHQIMYTPEMHYYANRMFMQKGEAMRSRLDQERFLDLVWFYERPYRLDFIWYIYSYRFLGDYSGPPGWPDPWLDWASELEIQIDRLMDTTPELFWQLCRMVWTDNENIHQHVDEWEELWTANTISDPWMDDENKQSFLDLPDRLELWRGECQDGGWSFSTDRSIGEFFAKRNINKSTGQVVHLQVPKDLVYCYIGDRGESEVIILESDLEEWELDRYSVSW